MNKSRMMMLCLVLVAACGKKDGGAASESTKTDGPTFTTGTLDVAGANALIPAALKDKIVFEKRAIPIKRGRKATTYTVAAPVGWKQGMDSFGDLKADDKPALTAKVAAENGADVFIFGGPRSTPQLSFTVRLVNASAGIVITALHLVPLVARMNAEERLLAANFGAEYEAYRARTWRLIPHLY